MPQILSKREIDLRRIREHFPDSQEFLLHSNPGALLARHKNESLEAAIKSGVITLRELANLYSDDLPILVIEAWLIRLNNFFNFKDESKMNDSQIQETSAYIVEDFSYFNIAEITLFFKRVNKGYYETYGHIDGPTILKAMRQFRTDRGNAIRKINLSNSDKMNLNTRARLIASRLKEFRQAEENNKSKNKE